MNFSTSKIVCNIFIKTINIKVKVSACLPRSREEIYLHTFLPSILVGIKWSDSLPCHFSPRNTPRTHLIEGSWVGPKAGLDNSAEEKSILLLSGIRPGFLSSPAHCLVTTLSYASSSPVIWDMLLFAASWHDGIVIKFLDGYHHGNWMTVVTLSSGLQRDLPWTSRLPIMELMQDVTCDSHIKQNWNWSLWLHEAYSKWTTACLAGLASTPQPQGHHIYIWTSKLQNVT